MWIIWQTAWCFLQRQESLPSSSHCCAFLVLRSCRGCSCRSVSFSPVPPIPSSQGAHRSHCTHSNTSQRRLKMYVSKMWMPWSHFFFWEIHAWWKRLWTDSAELTCPVTRVIKVHSKCVGLVVRLPWRWGAVLVVGVSVVVVHILPCQDGGPGRTAHGCRGESIRKMRAAFLHDLTSFVHGLHWTWGRTKTTVCRKRGRLTIQRPTTEMKGTHRDKKLLKKKSKRFRKMQTQENS